MQAPAQGNPVAMSTSDPNWYIVLILAVTSVFGFLRWLLGIRDGFLQLSLRIQALEMLEEARKGREDLRDMERQVIDRKLSALWKHGTSIEWDEYDKGARR